MPSAGRAFRRTSDARGSCNPRARRTVSARPRRHSRSRSAPRRSSPRRRSWRARARAGRECRPAWAGRSVSASAGAPPARRDLSAERSAARPGGLRCRPPTPPSPPPPRRRAPSGWRANREEPEPPLPPRDDRLGRRIDRLYALNDDGLVSRRADEMQLIDRERLDPPRRLQRFDFEAQAMTGFFLGRALPLERLGLITVAEQLEMLPGGKQQGEHEEPGDAHRFRELALARLVDFANDRIVPNILLDRVLECFHGAPPRC